MRRFTALVVAVLAVGCPALLPAVAAEQLSDPYEILEAHYDAVGGLDRLTAQKTAHWEGSLSAAGLTGTIEYWYERPGRYRERVDFSGRIDLAGDNGEMAWRVDSNGKLSVVKDERSLRLRELRLLMERYEHLDRNSDVFTATFEGKEPVDDALCYVVKTANTLDDAVSTRYFDAETLLERKQTAHRESGGSHTYYSDYRDVGGVTKAFRIESTSYPIETTQITQIERYEVNVDIDPALFDPPEKQAPGFTFTGGGNSVEIPFELIGGHIYLPVTINCRERLWVLDSGAGSSIIDNAYAEGLGLALEGAGQAAGAGQAVDVAFTTLPSFSLPGAEFPQQNILAIEIAWLFRKYSDVEVGGLLGYDFLSRFVSRVDYARSTITLYDPSSFTYERDGTILDAPIANNILTVPASLDGTYSGQCMLDLGATFFCFHYPFATARGFLERDGVGIIGMGAGGGFEAMLSHFESVELGGHVVPDPIALIPTEDVPGAFGSTDLMGTLGYHTFRHLVITLDYDRQRVIVERGADFEKVFPIDRSGLILWRSDDGEVEVFFVMPNTPADEAGFEKGDIIEALNGISTAHMKDLPEIRKVLEAEPGTSYDIRIKRGGETRQLVITLRDIL